MVKGNILLYFTIPSFICTGKCYLWDLKKKKTIEKSSSSSKWFIQNFIKFESLSLQLLPTVSSKHLFDINKLIKNIQVESQNVSSVQIAFLYTTTKKSFSSSFQTFISGIIFSGQPPHTNVMSLNCSCSTSVCVVQSSV